MWKHDEKVNNENHIKGGEDTKDLKSTGVQMFQEYLKVRTLEISVRISITLTTTRKPSS